MKKFLLSLNEKQLVFLRTILPFGYSLCKAKEAASKINNSDSCRGQKNDASLLKSFPQSYSSEQDSNLSSQKKKRRKPKLKKENEKQASKQKIKMKKQDPQNSSKTLRKVKVLTHILDEIQKKKTSQLFIQPVDPIKLQIPHYFDIIKEPMDLLTMRRKVIEKKYLNFSYFEKDLEKIASNCITFNKGNQFFFQTAQKFSKQCQKVLDKNRVKIDEEFKNQKESFTQQNEIIEPNSEEETNSQEEVRNIAKKKIDKKIQNKNKKMLNSEDKGIKKDQNSQPSRQKQNEIFKKEPSIQKYPLKQLNQQESNIKLDQNKDKSVITKQSDLGNTQKQRRDNDEIESKVLKQRQKRVKKVKKFSYDDRLTIISRIKKLDRVTMTELFKAIKFQKGSSLDFKVLQDEKVQQIDGELKKFEVIYEEKIRQIQEKNQRERESGKNQQDFEIAEDKDYED